MESGIGSHLDHQRWLLNSGLINGLHKDTLYLYGSLIHKDVQAVELDIDVEKKLLQYKVYVKESLTKKLGLFTYLKEQDSILALWRLRRLLKKNGNLDLKGILVSFVRDYCGPNWTVELNVKKYSEYEAEKVTRAGTADSAEHDRLAY